MYVQYQNLNINFYDTDDGIEDANQTRNLSKHKPFRPMKWNSNEIDQGELGLFAIRKDSTIIKNDGYFVRELE